MLSLIRNVQKIILIDNNIATIPSLAFNPIIGYQKQLGDLVIKGKNFGKY